jgi:hypothetical protein
MHLKISLHSLLEEVVIFAKKDFHLLSYCFTFLLISIAIYVNYSSGFYNSVMRETYANGKSVWAFPLFYNTMYFVAAVPVLIFQRDFKLLTNKYFYIKSFCFITLYGASIGYFGYRDLTLPTFTSDEKQFIIKLISQIKGSIIYILPVLFLKLSIDKNTEGIYGLTRNTKHIKAYVLLFILLLPFLVTISFTSDFLLAYPQFHPWNFAKIFNSPIWIYTPIYEAAYAIDFVKTELVFRGMLVIGMATIMDKKAVLPMAAMYAAVHFGKPLGETLSSIFGGYILGALAYQTKHIWGGVIVHICIALTMETMGFFQYYALKH